jgi:2,5-diketo-D-gluconate reductase A
MTMLAPLVTLTHGAEMPRLGLGTWPMDDAEAERVVAHALDAGYRLIDTAENYGNERGIGRALAASGVDREEIFLTTKFNRKWHGAHLVEAALDERVALLGVDTVDLLLIHWPNPADGNFVAAWEGMIGLLEAGRVRAIGTSNFKPAHIDQLLVATGVAPHVNQIQLNPNANRASERRYHEQYGILTESWSPVGGRRASVLGDPLVTSIAERLERTPAQIVLRWHLELGCVPIPKTSSSARLVENLDVFDFSLTGEDIASISALDTGDARVMDSDIFGH